MDRTMVKVTCIADWIKFRTIRRGYEALDGIAVSRGVFEDLEAHGYAAQNGSNSFAVFRRDCFRGTVSIRLAWLNYCGRRLFGWEECVILDYEKLMAFVRDSAVPNGPKEWRGLSVVPRTPRSRLVFRCDERLRECLDNKLVRHKLVKFLRDNFRWPRSERVEFYTDFEPYSFFFQEYCGGKPAMCGGLILHGQENMEKAYYSIHT